MKNVELPSPTQRVWTRILENKPLGGNGSIPHLGELRLVNTKFQV
ncbi:MAG: hypothetical protein PUP93_23610 [Rhizonema sp. NSF051]|nr:hypothetical protein [Rhizonema sp. NSF051]